MSWFSDQKYIDMYLFYDILSIVDEEHRETVGILVVYKIQ